MDLPKVLIQDEARRALLEDLGRTGDLSTQATIDPKTVRLACSSHAMRAWCVGCLTRHLLLRRLIRACSLSKNFQTVIMLRRDNHRVGIEERRSILSAERTALNFMSSIEDRDPDFAICVSDHPHRREDVLYSENDPWF